MITNFIRKNTINLSYEVETEEDYFILTVSAERVLGTEYVEVEMTMNDPDKIMSYIVLNEMVACSYDVKSIEEYVKDYFVKHCDEVIELYYKTAEVLYSMLSGEE